MPNDSFNLVDTVAVLQKRWKTILWFVVATVAAATIAVFVVPQYYRSSSLLVSANPALADKARMFNNQIQGLYSYFGSGDDLDRINGVADMDTTYKQLVDEFALIDYYQLKDDSLALLRRNAVLHLRKDLTIQKTEQAQLKIICWTKDKALSAKLVNRMVAIIQETETAVWQKNYQQSLEQLNRSVANMEQQYQVLNDSISKTGGAKYALGTARLETLLEQIKQYRKTADEFALAAATSPAAFYIMETAVPAAKAERPDKLGIILASMIVGFVFSCLLVLLSDRKIRA